MNETTIYATMPTAETWGRTDQVVWVRNSEAEEPWLAEIWRCYENGKIDYRPLRVVTLTPSPMEREMSDLSKRLRGRVHDSQMDNEYMMDEAADELDAKDAIIAELAEAVKRSNLALNDWLHQYAGEFCNEAEVEAAMKRIGAVGTIAYIADATKANRDALSKASQD